MIACGPRPGPPLTARREMVQDALGKHGLAQRVVGRELRELGPEDVVRLDEHGTVGGDGHVPSDERHLGEGVVRAEAQRLRFIP